MTETMEDLDAARRASPPPVPVTKSSGSRVSSLPSELKPISIDVEEFRAIIEEDGTEVTYYRIKTSTKGGRVFMRYARYSEFDAFHALMLRQSRGNHIRGMLLANPTMPPKASWFTNQKSHAFKESRRLNLDKYMRKLVALPRVPDDPRLHKFLGLEQARQLRVTVTFEEGALGMCLKPSFDPTYNCVLGGFQSKPDGSMGQAEASDLLDIGARVVEVNDVECIALHHSEVVNMIKAGGRPLRINFCIQELAKCVVFFCALARSSPRARATPSAHRHRAAPPVVVCEHFPLRAPSLPAPPSAPFLPPAHQSPPPRSLLLQVRARTTRAGRARDYGNRRNARRGEVEPSRGGRRPRLPRRVRDARRSVWPRAFRCDAHGLFCPGRH